MVGHRKWETQIMVRKLVLVGILGSGLVLTACNAVRGAGQDLQSAANCTENMINNGQC